MSAGVEAGVKYVKGNFLPTRTFRDLADLNAQARRWVIEEAGQRLHGTTRERPIERFLIEKPLMRALPPIAPDLGTWANVGVHRDCHVQFDRCFYSVPFTLVGRRLWLRATDTGVAIYQDYRLIATHLRARGAGTRRTVREHLPPEAQAFFARDRSWCMARGEAIGPACAELISVLLNDRILERLRAAQGVLRLAEQFEVQRVEAACQRALAHASPHYRTVKTILARGFDRLALTGTAHEPAASIYAAEARFARPARSLFRSDADHEIRIDPFLKPTDGDHA